MITNIDDSLNGQNGSAVTNSGGGGGLLNGLPLVGGLLGGGGGGLPIIGGLLGGGGGNSGQGVGLGGLMSPISIILSGALNLDPFSMIGNLGIMGGLNGQPGLIQGLFDKQAANTPFGSMFSALGLSGILPKGWIATGRDALPIAGSIFGNMFMPGIGGPVGSAAGKMGASMLLGNKGDAWKNANDNSDIEFIS